jgi:dihydroorotase
MIELDAMFDLIIKNATVVTPDWTQALDIGITQGKIVHLGMLSTASAKEIFNAKGLHILPGVIDPQVHFREPGLTHKEDISSGSHCAAMGGVTAFFEMPNTQPATDTKERLDWKLARASETSLVDFAFFVGATPENALHLGELEMSAGCAGVKMFLGSSTGTLLVDDPAVQLRVMKSGSRRVAVHSEDEARLKERKPMFEGRGVESHAQWRDEECAVISTRNIINLSREAKRKLHVLHVTSAGEIPLLAAARDLVTFEIPPQHLTFHAPEVYQRLGTRAQMNPPIRTKEHQAALWNAINNGLADCLGSDHAPHTLEEKAKPWPTSPSGMPGVQTTVPVMLTHVFHQKFSLERFVDLTSAGPARIYGIKNKGHIALGFDADFTVVDLKMRKTITDAWSQSRCHWTPFDGFEAVGWPVGTVVRGNFVMRDGELSKTPCGKMVEFEEVKV